MTETVPYPKSLAAMLIATDVRTRSVQVRIATLAEQSQCTTVPQGERQDVINAWTTLLYRVNGSGIAGETGVAENIRRAIGAISRQTNRAPKSARRSIDDGDPKNVLIHPLTSRPANS